MDLRDRRRKILKAVIESYIDTAEPVGSKTLADIFENAFSSATIRNDMSELEEMGYLEKPHVSAGRVPSYAAYRLYVNELMEKRHALNFEIEAMRRELETKLSEFEDLGLAASRIISAMSGQTGFSAVKTAGERVKRCELILCDDGHSYACVLLTGSEVKSRMIRLPFIVAPEDAAMLKAAINGCISENKLSLFLNMLARSVSAEEALFKLAEGVVRFIEETENESESVKLHVEGAEKILNMREFQDTRKARELMEYLSDKKVLSDILDSEDDKPVCIKIGPEIDEPRAKDASFVFTTFTVDGSRRGVVGIVAPTRMDYGKAIEYLASFRQAAKSLNPHKKTEE